MPPIFIPCGSGGLGCAPLTIKRLDFDQRTVPNLLAYQAVTWSDAKQLLVAVAASGVGNRVMTSPDGTVWTSQASAADRSWGDVIYDSGVGNFVALNGDGVAAAGNVMTSPDGLAWTSRSSVSNRTWQRLAFSPSRGRLVATQLDVGSGFGFMTSDNGGVTWVNRAIPDDTRAWQAITWSPDRAIFVTLSSGGANLFVMTSPDGIIWTETNPAIAQDYHDVAWSPLLGLFAAVGSNGVPVTSPDGITWTARVATAKSYNRIVWSPELKIFLAMSFNGTANVNGAIRSADGITWTDIPLPLDGAAVDQWLGLTWAPDLGRFVAVGQNGTSFRVMISCMALDLKP